MEIVFENENGERIPTDCRIENGMIIVSTKFKEFNPMDGDVVVSGSFVFIYNDLMTAEAYYYVSLHLKDNKIELPDGGHIGYVNQLRPAAEEEKKKLFDCIESEGYEWLEEERKLVKKKWIPNESEFFYRPSYAFARFESYLDEERSCVSESYINKGWFFRTEEECQQFCDKLNQAINQVKQ